MEFRRGDYVQYAQRYDRISYRTSVAQWLYLYTCSPHNRTSAATKHGNRKLDGVKQNVCPE